MRRTRGTLLWLDVPGLGARIAAQPYSDAARSMRVFRGIVLPPCDAFGGRLASAVADSFQIVFRRPTDAVLAAAALQDRAAQHAATTGERFDLRACVVSGEMRVDRDGVLGDLVDLAARVRAAASRGDVVLSGDVCAAMDKSQLTAEELGDADGVPSEVRLYRLVRSRGAELPYGGVGLAKAGSLPEIGTDGVVDATDSRVGRAVAPLRAAVIGVGPRASELAGPAIEWMRRTAARLPIDRVRPLLSCATNGVRLLVSSAAARLSRLPRTARWAAAGGLALLVALAVFAMRRDPIDRALANHDFRAAQRELKNIKNAEDRVFADARIEEARGSFGPAAEGYAKAARNGEKRGLKELVRMTESKSCDARVNAARALGDLGDPRAVRALRKLARAKFPDEPREHGMFRCNSRRAARDALEQIGTRG
ncbi:MAG TPA: HEAT repeat domain-containing protein [Myxococcales bacterium]|jgi:class 3 adenylate cyclase|nr:HEAT repeat domain-containing protein [Myxococcales bacterium]